MADTKETPHGVKPISDVDFVEHLTSEYKIIQDKIDKIGAFRFTIKGWSITVMVGALFAAGAATSSRFPLVLPLLLFLAIFFWLEKRQSDISHRLGLRALQIERTVTRFLRRSRQADFLVLRFVPGIGHHIKPEGLRSGVRHTFWRSCREAHLGIYALQAIVVLVVILWPHSNQSVPQHIVIENDSAIKVLDGVEKTGKISAGDAKIDAVGGGKAIEGASPTASPRGDKTHDKSSQKKD